MLLLLFNVLRRVNVINEEDGDGHNGNMWNNNKNILN